MARGTLVMQALLTFYIRFIPVGTGNTVVFKLIVF